MTFAIIRFILFFVGEEGTHTDTLDQLFGRKCNQLNSNEKNGVMIRWRWVDADASPFPPASSSSENKLLD